MIVESVTTFGARHRFTDLRRPVNHKWDNLKENYILQIAVKLISF